MGNDSRTGQSRPEDEMQKWEVILGGRLASTPLSAGENRDIRPPVARPCGQTRVSEVHEALMGHAEKPEDLAVKVRKLGVEPLDRLCVLVEQVAL